ncbi:LapA family protein [Hippea alviniae]|uniref:LapA family protein n=1 Tax=Hippea alviniae TaxID=1279027 RepID=UPI0003B3825E|nr:LapA family protein [Hippea alviniae]
MTVIRVISIVFVLAVLGIFIIYNTQTVNVSYLGIKFENMPLWLVVFISVFIGIFIGWFFMFIDELGLKRNLKNKEREIKALKEEIAQLRQLTITKE